MDLKVFVLLFWYWDGDGNLVHSYEGLYGSRKKAIAETDSKYKEWALEYTPQIYDDEGLLGADGIAPTPKPKESEGNYKSHAFWEIVTERISVYCEVL